MRTPKFKAQPTNAFFATINQMSGTAGRTLFSAGFLTESFTDTFKNFAMHAAVYTESIVFLAAINFISCDGRVVKALDLNSNGVSPRRFESCSQRVFACFAEELFNHY